MTPIYKAQPTGDQIIADLDIKATEEVPETMYAELRGFARSVSVEPMLAGVEETLRVVDNVSLCNPDTVWIGKMNKVRLRVSDKTPEIMRAIENVELDQRDDEILRLYQSLKDVPFVRWKDSIKVVLKNYGIEVYE